MMLVRRALLALALSAGPALAHGPGAFEVVNPRARIEGGVAHVYVTLVNKEAKGVQIVGAFSPSAEHAELRQGGKTVKTLAISPKGELAFAPGGYEITLLKLTRMLESGSLVPVILRLDDGDTFAVMAPVMR